VTGPAILQTVGRALDAAGIPLMLTGSFASAYHGAGRATMDVDLVIDPTPAQLRALIKGLPAGAWYASRPAAWRGCSRALRLRYPAPPADGRMGRLLRQVSRRLLQVSLDL